MHRYLIPMLAAALFLGCSDRPGTRPGEVRPGSSSEPPRLTSQPSPIDFGVLRPGQRASLTVTLHNRTPERVTVESLKPSCPCLKTDAGRLVVEGLGDTRLELSFDPSEEPDFRGKLSILLVGLCVDGTTCLSTNVSVEVR